MNGNQKTEPTINRKTARELELIQFKSGYEDGTIIAQQQHMNSVLGAISFAFFLALFSAGPDAFSKPALIVSEISFSASLVSNILLFFFYKTVSGKKDLEYIWDFEQTSYAEIFKTIALFAPIIGTFSLIFHYSTLAFIFSAFIAVVGFATFLLAKNQISLRDSLLSEYRLSLLYAGRDEDYFTLKKHEFKQKPSAEELKINKYDYSICNQKKELIGVVTLHHQAVVGDIIEIADSEPLTVLRIIHNERATKLICKEYTEDTSAID
ncbi:hypothetical protein [Pseudomonas sp. HS6]|uniref:hypothetical protein n=1 Tax=Pseudomonas sp. HS6 TaxID=2850559 RepID=UPI00201865B1|nr:hypothetical protein [Pseudomonas sp. HS6]UQS17588.1 hypothetical protein JJN09_12230 [Pseudomonas sp. HS6]